MQSKYVPVSVYPVDDSRRKSAPVSGFAIPALLGAMVGALAWPHTIWLAPLALLLLPVLNKRYWLAPFALMLGYHLATTYGLIKGTSVFFLHSGLFLGVGFWSLSSLAFALPYLAYPYIALYFRGGGLAGGSLAGGGFGAVTATIITSAVSTILPPLGIIGWTSPWLGPNRHPADHSRDLRAGLLGAINAEKSGYPGAFTDGRNRHLQSLASGFCLPCPGRAGAGTG
uniref:Apolipoprotein N-acyltransferase n=1 Tax=mine drainage metagenome TaxID=410659 RepID=E6QCN9_9ZZZZ